MPQALSEARRAWADRAGHEPALTEPELLLLLSGRAARRTQAADRIGELAAGADFAALARLFRHHRLLPLLGERLCRLAPDGVPDDFREQVAAEASAVRRRALIRLDVGESLSARLRDAGIPTTTLKGVPLALDLYDDPGMRPTTDVDLLVERDRLHDAVRVVSDYGEVRDTAFAGDLPLLHYRLFPDSGYKPVVELHWRIHWNEAGFSRRLVTAGNIQPADALATLLLFLARDSFCGMRLAVDVGAWWDRHGRELGQAALDDVLEDDPGLRPSLLAALDVVDRLVGVPRPALASAEWQADARSSRASRLANWTKQGSQGQIGANIALIDWLLSPGPYSRGFVRRYLLPPLPAISESYGVPEGATARQAVRCAAHAAGTGARLGPRFARALWAVRGGRMLYPAPVTVDASTAH